MFAAKAGAARVLAVDNSSIIDKARENIFHNSLSSTITTLHGAMEEVVLPVPKVDIIISEWMGYCLLYEAMLPSVLFARDKYLAEGGVVAPSSASMWIAPFADGDWVAEHIDFWKDVYGFDMGAAMQKGIYDDARAEIISKDSLCGQACPFRVLDLNTVRTEDLSFTEKWECTLCREVEMLNGFVVWFDNFFATRGKDPAPDAKTTPEEFIKQREGNVAFTTGPYGKETHWRHGLLIAPPEETPTKLQAGAKISGTIKFSVAEDYARGLNIEVKWTIEGREGERKHTWKLK